MVGDCNTLVVVLFGSDGNDVVRRQMKRTVRKKCLKKCGKQIKPQKMAYEYIPTVEMAIEDIR